MRPFPIIVVVFLPLATTCAAGTPAPPAAVHPQPTFSPQSLSTLAMPTRTPAPTSITMYSSAIGPTSARALDAEGPCLRGKTEDGLVATNSDANGRMELFARVTTCESQLRLYEEISSADCMDAPLGEPMHRPVSLIIGHLRQAIIRQTILMTPELAAMSQPDEGSCFPGQKQDIYLDFHPLVGTLAWSQDSRALTCVPAVDGPSTDLSAYGKATHQSWRLTDGRDRPRMLG
jgi:hypothetical protein